MAKKVKPVQGTYVKNPKCEVCKVHLTHEWLDGDYTLLLCSKKECWNKHSLINPSIS